MARHAQRSSSRLGRGAVSVGVALALFAVGACGDDSDLPATTTLPPAEQELEVGSPAFDDGDEIPSEFTCEGDDESPPITWANVPDGAEELALLFEDPDAPSVRFAHWVVAGIDPSTQRLEAGSVPAGAVEGTNDFDEVGYQGPCPPEGEEHTYVVTVLASDTPLELEPDFSAVALQDEIEGHEVGRGELTATFAR